MALHPASDMQLNQALIDIGIDPQSTLTGKHSDDLAGFTAGLLAMVRANWPDDAIRKNAEEKLIASAKALTHLRG